MKYIFHKHMINKTLYQTYIIFLSKQKNQYIEHKKDHQLKVLNSLIKRMIY